MNFKHISAFAGLITASVLAVSVSPAQAFTFTTNSTYNNNPKEDIFLKSVKLTDGTVINDFALVNKAKIVQNDIYTGGNSGAASSEKGDNAQGINVEDPTNQNLVTSLGNLNLNNIIDDEDTGSFKINLGFNKALDKLFFFERGMNSDLSVQALDTNGNLIGNLLTLSRNDSKYAGYSIDTTEIDGAQEVGSWGVSLADLGVSSPISRIQLTSQASFNGPDFKVVGAVAKSTPEPTSLVSIGLVSGIVALLKRRKIAK
ncbi:hypothetical protein DSM106972_097020 [Dulcicalothrix desertica PCC 7102]|uniref:PEP-CTERM protein-sorting domain-containing protein n=1 Tax=Dulcicalothrix desertica PCC 7102 TaxID=232991 RepID=A0A3S1I785_9CYAN|nr:exosortase-dependent surface protein XDP2 [Dulcicalothrix desertica]RUS93150.1 hypothetical protein DSM106972_097020 [Dulcicalothrix desertica PCC 7102]TWH62860.1 putative secreted protein with PEP-CTERM sorting signal [Dulcicalothrix desertica PCC 7102]